MILQGLIVPKLPFPWQSDGGVFRFLTLAGFMPALTSRGRPLQRRDRRPSFAALHRLVMVQFHFANRGGAAAERAHGRRLLVA